jgi:hypothetical protein
MEEGWGLMGGDVPSEGFDLRRIISDKGFHISLSSLRINVSNEIRLE